MRDSNAPAGFTASRCNDGSIPKPFRPFEEQVLRLLVTPVLGAACLRLDEFRAQEALKKSLVSTEPNAATIRPVRAEASYFKSR